MHLFYLICFLVSIVNALPVFNQHIVLNQQSIEEQWYSSQEYDMYSTIVDYYENLVDSILNTESEVLLLNLIHLPKDALNNILTLQAKELLESKSISKKQLDKMPAIVGRYIQMMNDHIFYSIEPTIKLHWNLSDKEDIQTFLFTLNDIVIKTLLNDMNQFHLLDKVRNELMILSTNHNEKVSMTVYEWIKYRLLQKNWISTSTVTVSDIVELEFLKHYLNEIRTRLLIESNSQFIDFYTRLRYDLIMDD
ncbi:uncharacterized protein BX663DRAFT_436055 [Cokeromyces recurvatus]|uniref:uncharacterized protein n=1 Tax=Cokeromyces recurvatus TaxID=90255 RepID=UPI00221F07FC|nr:uncharacterized protein BX663DRAFT_436055 [Cokeromyces recurvatus]KAI7902152.1 hypothetical protein BX663DRAFT_436055 [Cokeromyces recurvatus]